MKLFTLLLEADDQPGAATKLARFAKELIAHGFEAEVKSTSKPGIINRSKLCIVVKGYGLNDTFKLYKPLWKWEEDKTEFVDVKHERKFKTVKELVAVLKDKYKRLPACLTFELPKLVETEVRSVLSVLGQQPDKIDGNFFCNNHDLVSLAGAPTHVASFYCSDNDLVSLEGAPTYVSGNFWCNNNQLTSLAGSPDHALLSFYCQGNKLISLAGAPSHIDTIWCDDKLPLMGFLMTSSVKKLHKGMLCNDIVNPYLNGRPLKRREMLQLQQELINAGFEEEAQL